MGELTIIKRNYKGEETWRYSGYEISRDPHSIQLEAYYDREDTPLAGMCLREGDRFIETYYDDRWYNTFEIYDHEDDRLKGWYCNIGKPAVIKDDVVSYQDLALDLLVFPDGRQVVLDKDEFNSLPLNEEERAHARAALSELKEYFYQNLGKP